MVDQNKGEIIGRLREAHQEYLLSLARESVTAHLQNLHGIDPTPEHIALQQKRGIFVTILKKNSLRGCTGTIEESQPLSGAVVDFAISSATSDPRFSPITLSELPEVTFEISVLTPLRPLINLKDLLIGDEGLVVRHGENIEVLLPQVASRNGMTPEAFFEATCAKGRINPDQTPSSALELFTFATATFREGERGQEHPR